MRDIQWKSHKLGRIAQSPAQKIDTQNWCTLQVFDIDVCGNDSKPRKVSLNDIWHVSGSISRDFQENLTWKSHFSEFSEKMKFRILKFHA